MPDRPLNRICYVEDDEDIQRIVRMSLERIGKMTVAVVTDPTQAIAAMAEFRPDLVMLDWMMPVMDGPTLFRQMKLRPETAALPVVFITARASQRDLEDLKRLLRDESAGLLSICRKPDLSLPPEAQIESVASVIMELARGVMHVAPDVPSRCDYQAVGLVPEPVVA